MKTNEIKFTDERLFVITKAGPDSKCDICKWRRAERVYTLTQPPEPLARVVSCRVCRRDEAKLRKRIAGILDVFAVPEIDVLGNSNPAEKTPKYIY
jgi:hypothetical protein